MEKLGGPSVKKPLSQTQGGASEWGQKQPSHQFLVSVSFAE